MVYAAGVVPQGLTVTVLQVTEKVTTNKCLEGIMLLHMHALSWNQLANHATVSTRLKAA